MVGAWPGLCQRKSPPPLSLLLFSLIVPTMASAPAVPRKAVPRYRCRPPPTSPHTVENVPDTGPFVLGSAGNPRPIGSPDRCNAGQQSTAIGCVAQRGGEQRLKSSWSRLRAAPQWPNPVNNPSRRRFLHAESSRSPVGVWIGSRPLRRQPARMRRSQLVGVAVAGRRAGIRCGLVGMVALALAGLAAPAAQAHPHHRQPELTVMTRNLYLGGLTHRGRGRAGYARLPGGRGWDLRDGTVHRLRRPS